MSTERSVEFNLPVTNAGIVRLMPRLRERYLTPDVESAVVQAAGPSLNIWVWSERENVHIALPFDGFRTERPYRRSINSWGINVNRWLESNSEASLDVHYGSESGKEKVEATVSTFEEGAPYE